MNGRGPANGNRRQNILVTGGAGFIGSHVAEALHNQGSYVEVLDSLSTGNAAHVPPGVTLHVGDIRSDEVLRAVFRGQDFDAVVHCAAQTSVPRSMLDPELDRDVNVVGTRLLASRAREAGVRRFVFLSSGGAIYGEAAVPATECTLPAPRSYYGLHKFAAEELLRTEELSCAVLRPSNVYGSRQRADADGGVVAIFLQHLLRGEPLDIFGSGRQLRDFVHISDVVTAVVAALGIDDEVLWNVASGEAVSVLGLAEAMAEIARLPAHLRFQPPRAGDVASSLLSCATLAATGLWGPPLSIASGLRLTLAQYIRDLFQQSESAGAKAAR